MKNEMAGGRQSLGWNRGDVDCFTAAHGYYNKTFGV